MCISTCEDIVLMIPKFYVDYESIVIQWTTHLHNKLDLFIKFNLFYYF